MEKLQENRKSFSKFISILTASYPKQVDISKLIKDIGIDSTYSFLDFLNLLNIIEISDSLISIKSDIAKSFLESLKIYLDENLTLVSDWNGFGGENKDESSLDWGINLLREIEVRRVEKEHSNKFLRNVENISLIIKARLEGVEDSVYLFQFDPESLIFKAIGGKVDRKNEIGKQIKQLLERELGLNVLKKTYKFKEFWKPIEMSKISRKTGLYTKHKVYFYEIKFNIEELKLSSLDRWLTMEELKEYITNDGIEILSYFKYIEDKEEFINRLEDLEPSLHKEQEAKNFVRKDAKVIKNNHSSLDYYLKLEESDNLEFKSSIRWDYKASNINKVLEKVISKTLVGFMNSDGGTLIIGVDDDKKILGIQKDIDTLQKKNTDGFMQYIIGLVSNSMGIEFSNFIKINFEKVKEGTVCILEVKKSMQPVFYKDGNNREFYARAGNTTRQLNIEEIYKYIQLHW